MLGLARRRFGPTFRSTGGKHSRRLRLEGLEDRRLLSIEPSGLTLGAYTAGQGYWLDFDADDGLGPGAAAEVQLIEASDTGVSGTVSIPGAWLETVTIDGSEFAQLTIPESGHTDIVGEPRLPIVRSMLAVPEQATLVSQFAGDPQLVSLIDLGIDMPLAPLQLPVVKLPDAWEAASLNLDRAVYQADRFAPEPGVRLVEAGTMAGQRLVLAEFATISYNPLAETISVYDTLTFDVQFQGVYDATPAIVSTAEDLRLADLALNYEPSKAASKAVDNPDSPTGRLLVIVHSDFANDLDAYVDHKRRLGWDVTVRSTLTAGSTAESIRNYIRSYYLNPALRPDAVLLVGDTDRIPAFLGSGTGEPFTDLYYGCMDSGDDWYPEFPVGRFSVANAGQLAAVVAKTIDYESSSIGSWTKKAAFIAGNDNYSITESTHNWVVSNHLAGQGFTSDKLYRETNGATTEDVRDSLNAGRAFAIYSGHGGSTGWGDGPPFGQGDVQGLTNDGMFPFVASFACLTGNYSNIGESFMETWLRTPDAGAVVAVGSSVNSWWTEDDILEKRLFDAIYNDGYADYAGAWMRAKELYLAHFGVSANTRRYFEMYNVFGDPTVELVGMREDAYEQNDSRNAAWHPGVNWENTWLSSFSGVGVLEDADWYRIDVSSGYERVTAKLDFEHNGGDIDLQLVDSSGTVLVVAESVTDDELIDTVVPSGGTYYLRVYYSDVGNTYDLWWDDSQDDLYEQNDTLATAYDFSGSEAVWLSSIESIGVQSDDDWYQIEIDPGYERLVVDLTFTHADGDIDLAVYNADGQLWKTARSTTNNEQLDTVLPESGTWYLKVFWDDEGNAYDLKWDDLRPRIDLFGSFLDVVQEPLGAGDTFDLNFAVANDEADAVPPFEVQFYLSTNEAISTNDLFLGSRTVIGLGGNTNTGTLSKSLTLPPLGDSVWSAAEDAYYVGMFIDVADEISEVDESNNRNMGEFQDFDAVDIDADDPYEPNRSLATAYNISSQEQIRLSAIDGLATQWNEDWYQIDITPGYERLTVDLTFTDSQGDINLQVVDTSGNVWATAASTTNNETLDTVLPAAGTWYLRVYHGNQGNTYDLLWDDTAPRIDLRGSAIDIAGDTLHAGSTVSVDFTVINEKQDAVPEFDVAFYLSPDSTITTGDYYLGSHAVSGMGGYSLGGTLTTTLTLPGANESIYSGSGTYYIGMRVDDPDVITETNEVNNSNLGLAIDVDSLTIDLDDAYEPNDSLGAAYDFASGEQTWLSSVAGAGIQLGDDWYRIFLSEAQNRLIVNLTFSDADGNIDLRVYNSGGSLVASAASTNDNETLDAELPDSGTYYLKIFGEGTGNAYDLAWNDLYVIQGPDLLGQIFELRPDEGAPDDIIEVNALIQNLGPMMTGPFAVRLFLSQDTFFGDGDDVLLDTVMLAGVLPSGLTGFSRPVILPGPEYPLWGADGTYYIGMVIDANNDVPEADESNNSSRGEGQDYAGAEIRTDDLYEENDTLAEAFDPQFNWDGQWLSEIAGTGIQRDDDWYVIQVEPGRENVVVDATFTHAEGNIDLALYNAAGGLIASTTSTSNDEHINTVVPIEGTYYLRLFGANAGNRYDLYWQQQPLLVDLVGAWFDLNSSEFVAGDPMEIQFAVINHGLGRAGPFDVDFYLSTDTQFDQTDYYLGSEQIEGLGGQSDTGLRGLEALLPPRVHPFWPDDGEYYVGMVIDPGDVVVEADETNNAATAINRDFDHLQVTNTQDDAYEPNDSQETAFDYTRYEREWLAAIAGLGVGANDDWYAIDVRAGRERLMVDLLFKHDEGNLDLELLPPEGPPIALAASTDNEEYLDVVVPQAGIYYLRVYGANAANNYDLRWAGYAMPDLVGNSFDELQGELLAGADLKIEYEIVNIGRIETQASTVRFYLSANEVIGDADDYLLGEAAIGELSVEGTTGVLRASPRLPLPDDPFWHGDDRYFVGMVLDADQQIVEISETNNSSTDELVDYDSVIIEQTTLDDAYEQNDSLPTAYYPRNDWKGVWLSSIDGPAIQLDDDWYTILVAPDARHLAVDLQFKHAGGNLDLAVYDSSANLVVQSATTTDSERIDHLLPDAGTYYLKVYGSQDGNEYDLWWDTSPTPSEVVARHVFYNNSAYDSTSDADAIAPDKVALRPGEQADFDNYTTYVHGINGIILDVADLADPEAIDETDFTFTIGNDNTPTSWPDAPGPTSVDVTAGPGDTSRITLIWPDGAIRGTWLEVTMRANTETGLAADDVFYFGHLTGEATGDGSVDGFDVLDTRSNPRPFFDPAAIDTVHDFNRDRRVNAIDTLIARNNQTWSATDLTLLDLSLSKASKPSRGQGLARRSTAHDEVLREAGRLSWLHEFVPTTVHARRSKTGPSAESILDKLTADSRS